MAIANDDPTALINSTDQTHIYSIISKQDMEMTLKQSQQGTHGANTFIGCIVSVDRQIIYWINDTNPLP